MTPKPHPAPRREPAQTHVGCWMMVDAACCSVRPAGCTPPPYTSWHLHRGRPALVRVHARVPVAGDALVVALGLLLDLLHPSLALESGHFFLQKRNRHNMQISASASGTQTTPASASTSASASASGMGGQRRGGQQQPEKHNIIR